MNAAKKSMRKGLWNCAKLKKDSKDTFKTACLAEWDADLKAAKAVFSDYLQDSLKASNNNCKTLATDLRKADCNGRSPARNCSDLRAKVKPCQTFEGTKKGKETIMKNVLDGYYWLCTENAKGRRLAAATDIKAWVKEAADGWCPTFVVEGKKWISRWRAVLGSNITPQKRSSVAVEIKKPKSVSRKTEKVD
jgi:hypothetical protein